MNESTENVRLSSDTLLDVRDLKVEFRLREGTVRAVNKVSFRVQRGKTLGIIGESGSGKSVTAQALMRLTPAPGLISEGEIWLSRAAGGDILDLADISPTGELIRDIRWQDISMIFQEPMTSFSPVHSIEDQITEAMLLHIERINRAGARQRAVELLTRVGISNAEELVDAFPFQFSGGMRQRAMIAMALTCNPQLLIADEPTTALDVTIEAQILSLIKEIQAEYQMAVIFITHDIAVIGEVSDEVIVMYLGEIMEQGSVEQIFENPLHPYTRALWRSIPTVDGALERLQPIEGALPDPFDDHAGCPFFSRCDLRIPGLCDKIPPPLVQVESGHEVRCILYEEGETHGAG
ncbi:MAG: ABC transporter ATP-binding protein [Chloroflexota bacterium]|nr:ABC transporter ATP-binding protein [Chloroflexota bacterium]